MADFDPTQLTQFDLQNLPPEQAAALARAQQAALAQQQHHALLGMLSAMPELQKAGGAEYEQAGKERAGGRETAANIFKTALGMREADIHGEEAKARIKELELQGKHMMGMLGIAAGHLGLEQKQEGFKQLLEQYRAELSAQRPPTGKVEEDLLESQGRIDLAKKVHAPKALVDLLETHHEAKKKAAEDMGYRMEGPPKWPGGSSALPTAAPKAPRAPATAPAAAAPTAPAARKVVQGVTYEKKADGLWHPL